MKAKIIRTEADYEAVLDRISILMDSDPAPGSDQGEELELLGLLVEHYEEEHFPMDLPSPLTAIKFRMEQQGLKQKDLVPYIGSESKVSEVLSGKRSLSLAMIRRLIHGLGIPAEVLLQEPGAQLPDEGLLKEAKRFPLAEMVKRNWFSDFSGSLQDARAQLEDLMAAFIAPLRQVDLQLAYNRQHIRVGKKCDEHALLAWRIRVVALAQRESVAPYHKGAVDQTFLRELAKLSYLKDGPKLAREFLAKAGIPLVFERHLDKTYLDGAAIPLPNGRPMVAMSLRHDRLDNFWFTLFHELAHIALHLDKNEEDAFFDDTTTQCGKDHHEQEADSFAMEALIPADAWKAARLSIRSKETRVHDFANQLRISPAIPAGRLRYDSSNYTNLSSLVGNRQVRKHFEINAN